MGWNIIFITNESTLISLPQCIYKKSVPSGWIITHSILFNLTQVHCDPLNAMNAPSCIESAPCCCSCSLVTLGVKLDILHVYMLCSIYSNVLCHTSFCNKYHEITLFTQSCKYHVSMWLMLLFFTSPVFSHFLGITLTSLLLANPHLSAYCYSYPSMTVCW